MSARRIAGCVAAASALAAAGAGCGRNDSTTPKAPARVDTVVRTTRVEVLKALDQGAPSKTGFDPTRIYDREASGVVTVVSVGLDALPGSRGQGGLGSGFVISGSGEVATNAHVVTSGTADHIKRARSVYVRFTDGNQVPAKVLGFDPFSDVALLKVDPTGLTLRPLPLGSTKGLTVGAPVAAIGSPFGEEQSLSVGVVSATNRSIDSLTGFKTSGAIQTDAAINHGNSGGPLLDARGRVLGINSQIRTESGDGTGVGFAVPVDAVKRSLAQLRSDGKVRYAYLGIASRAVYPQLAQRFHLPVATGVWVQEVTPGGPAAHAGVRAGSHTVRFQEDRWNVGGDIVVGVDHAHIRKDDDLAKALMPLAPGATVTLRIYRDGKRQDLRVKLGVRPLGTLTHG